MSSGDPEVLVIGGGLAGMVASLRLVQQGISVRLYESNYRLGGKAGSEDQQVFYDSALKVIPRMNLPANFYSDHGYHIFPIWYTNMRALWNDIGLADADTFSRDFRQFRESTTAQRYNVTDAKPSILQMIRIALSAADLVTASGDAVEELTLRGFLASRIYNSRDSVTFDNLLLNALAIRDFDVSSRVVRNMFRQWFPRILQNQTWVGLNGSLQRRLINPIEAAIVNTAAANNVSFQSMLRHTIGNKGEAEITLERRNPVSGDIEPVPANEIPTGIPIILAVPQEVLRRVVDDDAIRAEPAFGNLQYLRSLTYSGLDIMLNRRVPADEISGDFFSFADDDDENEFGLSMLNVTDYWPEMKKEFPNKTLLQFVVGDPRRFNDASEQLFLESVTNYISGYIPDVPGNVEFYIPHQNRDAQLCVNDVGTWDRRPTPGTAITNLFVAGDFVQNVTEVSSMEGAVRTGNMVAEIVTERLRGRPVTLQEEPHKLSSWVWVLLWLFARLPVILIIALIMWLGSIIF